MRRDRRAVERIGFLLCLKAEVSTDKEIEITLRIRSDQLTGLSEDRPVEVELAESARQRPLRRIHTARSA